MHGIFLSCCMFVQVYKADLNGDKCTGEQHNGYDRYRYPCSLCDKRYTTKSHLDQHMQLHTGQFRFKCAYCQRGFNNSSGYKDHVRAHEGRKYHCEFCSKAFISQSGMKKHVLLHVNWNCTRYFTFQMNELQSPCQIRSIFFIFVQVMFADVILLICSN